MTASQLLKHTSCDSCSSSDANAVYSDGHSYCFSCGIRKGDTEESVNSNNTNRSHTLNLIDSESINKTIRSITPTTFQFWKYELGTLQHGTKVHVANHFRNGKKVGQKIRTQSKDFKVFGKMESLYGMWLWNKSQAKKIIITEGELDALSVSQVQNNKYPVVSLPNGAQGSIKSIKESFEYLDSFDEIILMFDMDEPGRDAALKAAQLFKPGKCKIAKLSEKDANAMLKAGKTQELISAIWNAEEYRPDGVVTLDDIKEEVLKPVEEGVPWAWDSLTDYTHGRRDGESYYIGAGTGVGKSAVLVEAVHHDVMELDIPCGVLFLEQSPQETVKRFAGLMDNKQYHVPSDSWTSEELSEAVNRIPQDKLFLYDNFGSIDWDIIKSRIRYLAVSLGCKHIFLDHLTALASHADDERKALEKITAEIAMLARELQIKMHVVSHLATPEGKSHEEGGRVMIRHFKGSRSIGFWADYMFGLERHQQHEDESERNITTFRVLKDRYTGQSTGKHFELQYDHESGRLTEYERELESAFNEEDLF